MSRSRPAALVASLAIHLAFFVLLFFLKGPSFPEPNERRVLVQFDAAPRPLPEAARAQELPRPAPAALGDSLRLQGPGSLELPGGSAGPAAPSPPAAAASQPTPLPVRPQAPAQPAAVSLPTAEEVLAMDPAATAQTTAVPGPASRAADGERGFLEPPALEWKGRARTLLTAGSLAFPDVLLREGRDVDVEAVFTVAASGQVVRVEIVHGSGYAAVDREVEKTILGYLFEPAREGSEDTGRVQFRFRLERDR